MTALLITVGVLYFVWSFVYTHRWLCHWANAWHSYDVTFTVAMLGCLSFFVCVGAAPLFVAWNWLLHPLSRSVRAALPRPPVKYLRALYEVDRTKRKALLR